MTMDRDDDTASKFGTFGGVFTPCTLTILGVIMFLRFGYVVGQAGVWQAVSIVLVANVITVLTGLSLSAIATNTRVGGGGAYFLISRSLGVEFGGSIGVVFFLAQAISVAMYVIGFSEAYVDAFPTSLSRAMIATAVNGAVCVCVYVGASWTIKVQYVILGILVLSLGSFGLGAWDEARLTVLRENVGPGYVAGASWVTMFALFFPAVTGIMAGANMSGDLKQPGRAIPRGTLAAIGVTAVIYVSMAVLLGMVRPREALLTNTLVVRDVALSPVLITAGIFAATLSSAMGSMMGAPRILQALARDDVFRWLKFFAKGGGRAAEPRRAALITFAIAQTCILVADLDTIAPLITMAFLITYGLLNLATFYEAITKNPSYRPRFRFCHWTTSLAGAVGSVGVMFLINWVWATVSIVLMALLHWIISRKEIETRWGDVQSGLLFERARRNLLRLESALYHPKNWRPIILALSGGGWSRPHLAVYGHWFTAGKGILSLGQIIQGDVEEQLQRRINQQEILHQFIRDEQLEAFPAVVVAPYLSDGIEALVQCHGLGAVRPNTVLLGWPGDPERAEATVATLRTIAGLQCSIVAVRFAEEPGNSWDVPEGTLDVWWRGQQNGELMVLLAHLLATNAPWRAHSIRVLRVIENEAGADDVRRHLNALIETARIQATPHVIVSDDPVAAIQRTSRSAALVFLGFEVPEKGQERAFFDRMERWAGQMSHVVFVDSTGGMSLES